MEYAIQRELQQIEERTELPAFESKAEEWAQPILQPLKNDEFSGETVRI